MAAIGRRGDLRVPMAQPRRLALRLFQGGLWGRGETHGVPEEVGRDPVRADFEHVPEVRRKLQMRLGHPRQPEVGVIKREDIRWHR